MASVKKSKRRKKPEKKIPIEAAKLFFVTYGSDREDGRVNTIYSDYYYKEYSDAQNVAREISNYRNAHSIIISQKVFLKVGDNYYERAPAPAELEIVNPSDLEKHVEETVGLKVDENKVVVISASPVNEKIK